MFHSYLKSSIGKKQIVAVTGLMLILFLMGHLAGNCFIYLGPAFYNGYAKKLAGLRPGLFFIEAVLGIIFLTHVLFTVLVVLQNIQARPIRYQVFRPSETRSLATRLMPLTGTIIFLFVIAHLLDFTFIDHHGPSSILPDGKSYGLYGVVLNALSHPIHGALYILAMGALGLHLIHAIESFLQTFGLSHPLAALTQKISGVIGLLFAVAYGAIPLYAVFHIQTFQ